ncbi:MAG: PLD nuclease N-terminal domain-containing protein, partial [Thermodesulfobacteriota bacterium]|nr:PLD nuclease N-terminal domain-containing protein [Thermodesulfobacteriota bacterium]
ADQIGPDDMSHTLIILLFVPIIFTFWAIVDLAHRDLGSMKKKALWGLFVVFVPYVGGPVYLLFGRRQGSRKPEED